MTQEELARINELARKQKSDGLSESEAAEQQTLRQKYLADFRASFTGILENTYIKRPNGEKEKLKKTPKE